jgi:6-phosphogluconolactonase
MITRRRFLVSLPAFAAASRLAVAQRFLPKKKPVAPPPVFVYFGTDTTKGISKGIYESRFDPATGKLTAPALIAATPRPTFLALSAAGHGERHLYAVNAMSGAQATVTSFTVDPAAGTARQLNQVSSAGDGPCYISLDRTGRAAFVANSARQSPASTSRVPATALAAPTPRARMFPTRTPSWSRPTTAFSS